MNKVKNIVLTAVEPVSGNGKEIKPAAAPSIEDIKKLLEDQIALFNRKAELIAIREKFQETRNDLVKYLADQGADFDDNLDSPNLRIQLSDNKRYRGEGNITISNNLIVREFIEYVIRKIDVKVLEIEKEILG